MKKNDKPRIGIRFWITLSVGLYLAAVFFGLAVPALLFGDGNSLSIAEMIYGPAITIGSCWIIYGIVYAIAGDRAGKQ